MNCLLSKLFLIKTFII